MTVIQQYNKHIEQIKKGGLIVFLKKLRSFLYQILLAPIYLISIPLVIIIRLIKPWFLIRWYPLNSGRIGHFAVDTELYCCKKETGIDFPSQRHMDLLYLGSKYVCNKQLEKMWKNDQKIRKMTKMWKSKQT